MGVVDRICILVAELMHDLGYSIVVLCIEGIPDQGLELEGSALALVIELIIQRFSDIGIHGGVVACVECLHAGAACLPHAGACSGYGEYVKGGQRVVTCCLCSLDEAGPGLRVSLQAHVIVPRWALQPLRQLTRRR
jgi:hypothetical protein